MKKHKQEWVKTNTLVDEGISGIVLALSQLEGLQTLESCQGYEGRGEGFVYFYYGDWEKISRFVFSLLAPALHGIDGAAVSVEIFNGSEPMGKLSFRVEALPQVASALKRRLPPIRTER